MRVLRISASAMQRVNGYQFYDLAVKIHPLREVKPGDKISDQFWRLWEGRDALISIFSTMPLRVCLPAANKIVHGIDSIFSRDFSEAVKQYKSEDLVGVPAYTISEAALEFATVLAAELQSLDTYLVSQKGTHSTPDLIERAEIMLSAPIRKRLPEQAIIDIRQAGRCLALDNPTASAFHILRAVESVMAIYFERVTGKPLPTRMRNWSIYLKSLKKHPGHSERVVTFLDHIRDSYRNPILHPEIVINEDEAEALLGASASAIRLLVMEIEALEEKAMWLALESTNEPEEPPAAVA
jgi:hypothetical protein